MTTDKLKQAMALRAERSVESICRLSVTVKDTSHVELHLGRAWCRNIDVTFSTIYPAREGEETAAIQLGNFLTSLAPVPKANIADNEDDLILVEEELKSIAEQVVTNKTQVFNTDNLKVICHIGNTPDCPFLSDVINTLAPYSQIGLKAGDEVLEIEVSLTTDAIADGYVLLDYEVTDGTSMTYTVHLGDYSGLTHEQVLGKVLHDAIVGTQPIDLVNLSDDEDESKVKLAYEDLDAAIISLLENEADSGGSLRPVIVTTDMFRIYVK